jgi:hypothetical protein
MYSRFAKSILGVPMSVKVVSLTAVAAVACMVAAHAHHSFAMFDAAKTVTLQGTVTEYRWANPRAWLHVMAGDGKMGRPASWAIELDSPARLTTMGIRADYVKAGDAVLVTFHPARDGTRRGQFVQAVPLGQRYAARSLAVTSARRPLLPRKFRFSPSPAYPDLKSRSGRPCSCPTCPVEILTKVHDDTIPALEHPASGAD